jgi:hypothetical protein
MSDPGGIASTALLSAYYSDANWDRDGRLVEKIKY